MKHGVERFVYLSTSDVYGLRDFHGETEEEAVRVPFVRNYYPRSKIFAGLKRPFRKDVLRSFGLSLRGETAIRRSRRALKDPPSSSLGDPFREMARAESMRTGTRPEHFRLASCCRSPSRNGRRGRSRSGSGSYVMVRFLPHGPR